MIDKLKPLNTWVKNTKKKSTFEIRPPKLPIEPDVVLEIDN